MNYLLVCMLFGAGIIALTILGEYIALKLPASSKYTKWWRKHMIGDDPFDNKI